MLSSLSSPLPSIETLIETLVGSGRFRSRDEVLQAALRRLLDEERPKPPELGTEALLDAVGVAFYALDRHWRFTTLNEGAERYFQRPRAELVGRKIWDLFPWSEGTDMRVRFEEAMRSGEPVAYESPSVGVPGRQLEIRLFRYGEGLGVSFRDRTERHATEAALKASEGRLRLAVEAGRLAIWEVDVATEAFTPSPELNQLLGFPRDATPSLDEMRAGYMPGERERVQAAGLAAIARGDRFFELEYRYRRHDGPVIWLLMRAEIQFDAAGRPARVVGVQLDVTDRKEAEEALRESQARLAIAAGAADLGIWDWDIASGRMIYSDRARRIFGFPAEGEITYETVRAATHPDDLSRIAALARRSLDPAVRERAPYEYRVVHPDGSVRWVLAHGEAVFATVDGVERAVRYVGTLQDITERRQAAEALAESQARLEALADNMPLGMVFQVLVPLGSTERRFLYVSRSCERLNGVRAEDVMADHHRLYDLVHEEDWPRMVQAEREAIATRSSFDMEVRMRHAQTGEVRRYRIISAPRELPSGDMAWDGIQIDVTDQRTAEEALRESEARVTALADNLPLGMVYQTIISPDQQTRSFTYLSQSCERMNGISAEAAIADPSKLYDLILPDSAERMIAIEAEAIRTLSPFEAEVAARHARTGEVRWYRLMSAPRRLSNGDVIWDGIQIDVTLRRRAEEALRRSEERLRTILDEMPVGVALARIPDGAVVFRNGRTIELLGLTDEVPQQLETYGQYGAIHADGTPYRTDEYPLARTVMSGADIDQEEMTYRRPDGRIVHLAVSSAPVQGTDGQTYGICAFYDITERKKAEEHQRLLINELNHRVKNTLATVQSIAAQSFRAVETSQDWTQLASARQAFEARIFALARAHDVLTRENWEGASLADIVMEVTAPHRGGPAGREPFTAEGPDLRLSPSRALSLAMALHELCTNAVKYGALGQPGGRVRMSWTQEPRDGRRVLRLRWQERGGPPVIPPTRRGFGTRLLERGLAHELGGTVTLAFDPSGLICTIEVPLS